MPTSAPHDSKTPGNAPDSAVPVAPDFDETLRKFWKKNAKVIYLACATVFLVIVAKGVLEYTHSQKEKEIGAAYAAASTTDQLKRFASEHPDHLLGAAASLRIADEAYSAGKYTEAVTSYQQAAAVFKTGPFAGRALIGAALSKVMSGQTADGEAKLKQVADDTTQPKIIRAEATYHLGTIALEAGRNDDASKYFDLVAPLDATGNWAQRAMMQRLSLPAAPAPTLLPSAKP